MELKKVTVEELGLVEVYIGVNNTIENQLLAKEDEIGSRGLKIRLVDEYGAIELDEPTVVRFYGTSSDGKKHTKDCVRMEDSKGVYFELIYPSKLLKLGNAKGELRVKKSLSANNISTRTFNIRVYKGIMGGPLEDDVDDQDLIDKILDVTANEDYRVSEEIVRGESEQVRRVNEDYRVNDEENRQLNEVDRIEMYNQVENDYITGAFDGDSAYQVWLNEGNEGTIKDYLDNLKGEEGEQGQQGPSGGVDGEDGRSAYEVWLDEGNEGTIKDYLDSLKGEKGEKGEDGEGSTGGGGSNLGSVSGVDEVPTTTNEYLAQVNVSTRSSVRAKRSQVNASVDSYAAGDNSPSGGSGMTQVNASWDGHAHGSRTQINASKDCETGTFKTLQSQINASTGGVLKGENSQLNATLNSYIDGGDIIQINASERCSILGVRSQINSSYNCRIRTHNAQINSSHSVHYSGHRASVWGSHPSSNAAASSSNIKIRLSSGSGNIEHSGVLNSGHDFTDYAELFPNATNIEQGYGLIQTIDGHAVRPANQGDQVVGVTSATAGVVLGETPFSWKNRWIKNEWGEMIYYDVPDDSWIAEEGETESDRPLMSVPKENEDWDPELKQITRQDRPDEWTVVGLVGQVYVRLNKDVDVMDYVKPYKDGVGQTSEEPTNIRVMKITQDYDEGKGYKIGFCFLK